MKRKIIYWLLILIFMAVVLFLFGVYIKKSTFPFISLTYIETPKNFNQCNDNCLNLDIPLTDSFKKQVRNKLEPLLTEEKGQFFETVSLLTEYTRTNLFHKYKVLHNVEDVLKSEGEDPAICSGYAKFFAAVAQALGYKSRVVWMNGHTVSEIYWPNYGWVLIDTSGNILFQDDGGNYLGLLNIVDNFEKSIPKNIINTTDSNNDKDFLSSGNYKVYDKNEIVVVLEGKRLFDFDLRTRSPSLLIKYILGKEEIANGIQYINNNRKKLGNFRLKVLYLFLFEFLFFVISLIIYFRIFKNSLTKK